MKHLDVWQSNIATLEKSRVVDVHLTLHSMWCAYAQDTHKHAGDLLKIKMRHDKVAEMLVKNGSRHDSPMTMPKVVKSVKVSARMREQLAVMRNR